MPRAAEERPHLRCCACTIALRQTSPHILACRICGSQRLPETPCAHASRGSLWGCQCWHGACSTSPGSHHLTVSRGFAATQHMLSGRGLSAKGESCLTLIIRVVMQQYCEHLRDGVYMSEVLLSADVRGGLQGQWAFDELQRPACPFLIRFIRPNFMACWRRCQESGVQLSCVWSYYSSRGNQALARGLCMR